VMGFFMTLITLIFKKIKLSLLYGKNYNNK